MKVVKAKDLEINDRIVYEYPKIKTIVRIEYFIVKNAINVFFHDGSYVELQFEDLVSIANELHCDNCFDSMSCKNNSDTICSNFTFKDGNCHASMLKSYCKYIGYGCKGCLKESKETQFKLQFTVPKAILALSESTPLNHPNCKSVITDVKTPPKDYSRLLELIYGISKVEFFTKKDRTTTVLHFPDGDRLAVRQSKDDDNDLEFAIIYAYYLYYSGLTKTQAKKQLSEVHNNKTNTMWKKELVQREKEYLYSYLMDKTGKDKIAAREYVKGFVGLKND